MIFAGHLSDLAACRLAACRCALFVLLIACGHAGVEALSLRPIRDEIEIDGVTGLVHGTQLRREMFDDVPGSRRADCQRSTRRPDARWRIDRDRLVLVEAHVFGCDLTRRRVDLKRHGAVVQGGIVAAWFTGVIDASGHYVKEGGELKVVQPRYTAFVIERGKVRQRTAMDEGPIGQLRFAEGASEQAPDGAPDVIELDGEAIEIRVDLLQDPMRDRRLQRLREALESPQQGGNSLRCTVKGRGYTARWRVRDDELQLVGIVSDPCLSRGKPIEVREFGLYGESPARAHWLTGHFLVPRGNPPGKIKGTPSQQSHVVLIVQRGRVLSRTLIRSAP